MAMTARLDLSVWRNDDVYETQLRVKGLDLSAATLRAQIRLAPDTPGAPLVDLATVANGNAEGIRVASVVVEDGVTVSNLRIRLNKSTRQGLPYSGELGDAARLAWAFSIDGRTRIVGDVIILAHALDSDAAPTSRPAGYSVRSAAGLPSTTATLTVAGDDVVSLVIDGADELQPLYRQLVASAASLEAASGAAEQFAADASLAAAAAVAAGKLYETAAAGLAATLDGQFFLVRGSGSAFADLYRRSGSSAILQPNQLPSAAAIANKIDRTDTRPITIATGDDNQSGFAGRFQALANNRNQDAVFAEKISLGAGATGYAVHGIHTGDAASSAGGGGGFATDSEGYSLAVVANKRTNVSRVASPGAAVQARLWERSIGDAVQAIHSSSQPGRAGYFWKTASDYPEDPDGPGDALEALNSSSFGKALLAQTSANNVDILTGDIQRDNGTQGTILRVRTLGGGARTAQLTGTQSYILPQSASTGPSGVIAHDAQINGNVTGSADTRAFNAVNLSTGGAAAFGLAAVSAGTGNAINYGVFAQAANGTANHAFYSPGGLITINGDIRPLTDGGINLGGGGARFGTIFATSGVINTSDAREKNWLGGLTESHLRAARQIGDVMGLYQWLDQVSEKGEDGARIHFGVKAQDVVEIFYREGLETRPSDGARPNFRHAFLCYDEWEDVVDPIFEQREVAHEVLVPRPMIFDHRGNPMAGKAAMTKAPASRRKKTGVLKADGTDVTRDDDAVEVSYTIEQVGEQVVMPAGNRYGLRLDQLALFLAAASAARLSALEAAA